MLHVSKGFFVCMFFSSLESLIGVAFFTAQNMFARNCPCELRGYVGFGFFSVCLFFMFMFIFR